jgi:hypothetical protein
VPQILKNFEIGAHQNFKQQFAGKNKEKSPLISLFEMG